MRITIDQVNTSLGITNTYDIVNAIRNSSSDKFQQYVPLADSTNVADVGAGILVEQSIQNEFITSLVDRIGKVVITRTLLKNPLSRFKKGKMPEGRTIEQIYTDITASKKYDPSVAEAEVFKREIPNVRTLFHERNRQEFYKQTVSDSDLQSAFISWNAFGNFVASIMNAMYNSAEVDEYEYMKLIIDNYYAKGQFTVVPVTDPSSGATAAKEFVKKVRAYAMKASLPNGSRDYNALAVHTKSDMDNLHLIITADLRAELDVDVLADAFNMGKADFLGHVTVIDNFASDGLQAVLVDYEWFMVYDNLIKMETIRNPQGLYWNYFLHIWQTLSASRFSNAIAFVSGAVKAVTQVIVDPAITSIKQGSSYEFTAYVRTTDGGDYPVTWSVIGNTASDTVQAGTTIDANGKLTLDATQTGTLMVKATVNVDPDGTPSTGDEYSVVGESVVAVIPS